MLMSSNVLASAAHLRTAFRRLQSAAVVQGIAVMGLIPLVYYGPRLVSVRALLLLLVAAYFVRKVIQYAWATRAMKQLRMETQFIRYSHDPQYLGRCVRYSDHLWTRSCVLIGLKGVLAGPTQDLVMTDEKRRRVGQHYLRVLKPVRPRRAHIDLGILLTIVFLLSLTPKIPFEPGLLVFQAGLVGLLLSTTAEVLQSIIQRDLTLGFDGFIEALVTWTLSDRLQKEMRPQSAGSYTHRLLYQSYPWFAGGQEPTTPVRSHVAENPVS
jgi:hypothetical protein